MKRIYLFLIAIALIIAIPIISYGYDGRFYSIDLPEGYKEHNAESTIDETSIVFRKSNASAAFGLKGDIQISAEKTSSGKKTVNGALKSPAGPSDTNSSKDSEVISTETIRLDGEKGVKSVKKENGKFIISYQVATNTKLVTVLISSDNADDPEFEQIVNSLKIKKSVIDYWQLILVGIVLLIILNAIIGKVKGKGDNGDFLSR